MGFLDNLLKKETRKIIAGVVDSVVDNVMDDVKGSIHGGNESTHSGNVSTHSNNESTVTRSTDSRHRESETGDDADCCFDESTIRRRIEMAAAEDWPGYELRRDIPASEFGGDVRDHGFDYGLYLDGRPMVMIMILEHYQYRNRSVQNAHAACRKQGIGSFHLLNHLPNRKTYIAERIKAVMPR